MLITFSPTTLYLVFEQYLIKNRGFIQSWNDLGTLPGMTLEPYPNLVVTLSDIEIVGQSGDEV